MNLPLPRSYFFTKIIRTGRDCWSLNYYRMKVFCSKVTSIEEMLPVVKSQELNEWKPKGSKISYLFIFTYPSTWVSNTHPCSSDNNNSHDIIQMYSQVTYIYINGHGLPTYLDLRWYEWINTLYLLHSCHLLYILM